jgi:hypothetical protein
MDEITNQTVAEFMNAELDRTRWLYQEDIAAKIQHRFGKGFVYFNENGNLAISKEVLREFRKLTPDCVWVRSDKSWRKRDKFDEAGKRAQD